jgi:hypothetical protein
LEQQHKWCRGRSTYCQWQIVCQRVFVEPIDANKHVARRVDVQRLHGFEQSLDGDRVKEDQNDACVCVADRFERIADLLIVLR